MLFPNGIAQYAAGGFLVGLGVLILFAVRGGPVGASTGFAGLLSCVSRLPFLRDQRLLDMRASRLVFSLGFIIGGLSFAIFTGHWFATGLPWWRLFIGGILVGFGTRMGRGCTSGHGVCGIGSRSFPSLVAVVVFTLVAIITANLVGVLL